MDHYLGHLQIEPSLPLPDAVKDLYSTDPPQGNIVLDNAAHHTAPTRQPGLPYHPGDETAHPQGRISDPLSSKPCLEEGTQTTKMVALKIFRREGCTDASLVVLNTPSPLSRKPTLKIVRRGVCYIVTLV